MASVFAALMNARSRFASGTLRMHSKNGTLHNKIPCAENPTNSLNSDILLQRTEASEPHPGYPS
jgi:hypothetical protein